jgi:myo-inositol 2-dehydrogenase/D-chiro-inositol 1-dehydrogenase
MISIALLGAGRIGQIHGRTIAASKRARLAAIADPFPDGAKALSAATGAPVREADEILADKQIDAVLIATPTDTHADFIDRAAAAGKSVLCEKPLDMSSARIKETLARVQKAGVKLMIGFNRRFDPNFAALQKRLAEGVAGNVELVSILSRDPAPPPISYIERSGGL